MEQYFSKTKLQNFLTALQIIVLICLILYFGKAILVPLSFSLLISFILFPVCKWLENKGIYHGLAITVPVFVILFFGFGLVYLLISQLLELSHEWPNIKGKLFEALDQFSILIADKFGMSGERQKEILLELANKAGNNAFSHLGETTSSISEGLFFLIMIPIFSSLILYYRHKLVLLLYHLFPTENKSSIVDILIQTINTYYNFIKGMLMVYLIVGVLNSVGLALLGIPHPILFGFIAAILTFIPYVGIMIGSLLPIVVSWITYDSIWYPVGVIVIFGIVQTLEAYLIFPLVVGTKLQINTLVVFLAILIGGMLWGAAGMILFIPMVSILKIIADKSPKLKYISEVLGE